jgi:hypothetical protein
MRISDDAQLDENFNQLCQRLFDPDALSPLRGAPIFYFVYDPRQTLAVRRLMPGWIAKLHNEQDLKVKVISMAAPIWKLIDESGRWEAWLEAEHNFDQSEINKSITSVLQEDNLFVERAAAEITVASEETVVFVTDTELLHPFGRTRPLEGYLQNRLQTPTVFFYPGRRVGQYGLKFLGFYPDDTGYRSTLIGE